MRRFLAVAFLVFFGASFGARAEYKMGTKKPVKTDSPPSKASLEKVKNIPFPSKDSHQANPEKDALQSLSAKFDLPVDRLRYFRELNHGYEEIVPALIFAREAQLEIGKVLQSRVEGKSWEQIAGELDVDLKSVNAEAGIVLDPIRKTVPQNALMERPQTRK